MNEDERNVEKCNKLKLEVLEVLRKSTPLESMSVISMIVIAMYGLAGADKEDFVRIISETWDVYHEEIEGTKAALMMAAAFSHFRKK